jgi:hypothetical protein
VPNALAIAKDRRPIPVALPAPTSANLGLWTEDAWEEHARRHPGIYGASDSGSALPQLPMLVAVLLPFMVVLGANAMMMWIAIVFGALISGYTMRRDMVAETGHPILAGAMFIMGMVYYAILAEVFLLGGCCWPGRM